jgi:hypothetical protein
MSEPRHKMRDQKQSKEESKGTRNILTETLTKIKIKHKKWKVGREKLSWKEMINLLSIFLCLCSTREIPFFFFRPTKWKDTHKTFSCVSISSEQFSSFPRLSVSSSSLLLHCTCTLPVIFFMTDLSPLIQDTHTSYYWSSLPRMSSISFPRVREMNRKSGNRNNVYSQNEESLSDEMIAVSSFLSWSSCFHWSNFSISSPFLYLQCTVSCNSFLFLWETITSVKERDRQRDSQEDPLIPCLPEHDGNNETFDNSYTREWALSFHPRGRWSTRGDYTIEGFVRDIITSSPLE